MTPRILLATLPLASLLACSDKQGEGTDGSAAGAEKERAEQIWVVKFSGDEGGRKACQVLQDLHVGL